VLASFCEVCSAVKAGASPIGDCHLASALFFTHEAKGFLGQNI
jgi:hypothetical protein